MMETILIIFSLTHSTLFCGFVIKKKIKNEDDITGLEVNTLFIFILLFKTIYLFKIYGLILFILWYAILLIFTKWSSNENLSKITKFPLLCIKIWLLYGLAGFIKI